MWHARRHQALLTESCVQCAVWLVSDVAACMVVVALF
jgi:hypothetical protein